MLGDSIVSSTHLNIPPLECRTEGCAEHPLEMNASDQHLIHQSDKKFREKNNLEEFLDHIALYVLML